VKRLLSQFAAVVLALVPLGCRGGSDSDAATLLSQLEATMREEIAHDQSPPQSERRSDLSAQRSMALLHLRSAFARPESAEFEAMLNQIPSLFHSENVRKNVDGLRAVVAAQREAKEKALAEKIEKLLAGAAHAVETAHQTRDLDAAIRDLNAVTEFRENASEKARILLERLRNARQFVIYWQDYLDHRAGGRLDLAEQSLKSASSVATANLIPRSAILERLAEFTKKKEDTDESPFPRLRSIMEHTKTVADLQAAIDALEDMRRLSKKPDDWANPIVILHRELVKLQQCYSDFKRGLPTVFSLASPEAESSVHPEVIQLAGPLKIDLARLMFPRFLRVDQPFRKDEPIDDYVDRMMHWAFERCDARLIMRVYELRSAVNRTQPVKFSKGLDALLAAQNQEQAGQFLLAVIWYQKALRAGGDLVPAESIGSRLEAIKNAHPAEYDAAMKRYLSEPDVGPPVAMGGPPNYSLQIPGSDPGEQRSSP
jgi:hypothetical protein